MKHTAAQTLIFSLSKYAEMKSLFSTSNTMEHPRLIGHRGFTVLAPENSLPSFDEAGKHKFWAIETDVRMTKDGVLVCCHNNSTRSMYNAELIIEESDFADLLKLKIVQGSNVDRYSDEELKLPTFAEYIAICKKYGSVPFIETKGEVVEQVLQYLRKIDMIRASVLSSIKFEHIEQTRKANKEIFVHHIFSDENKMLQLSQLGNCGVSYNYPNPDDAPKDLLKRTHESGVKFCLRAGDTKEAVLKMLGMGLDYIPTNKIYSIIE